MKKRLLILMLSVVVAPLVIAGCTSPVTPSPSPSAVPAQASAAPATSNAIPVSPSASPSASSGTQTVAIPDLSFQPSTLMIQRGTTVMWRNDASVPHQIVSNTGAFSSQVLNPGQTYSHQFTQAGAYPYHCGIHPSMTGTITVQ